MILKPKYMARFRHVAGTLMRYGFADVLGELDLNRFLPGKEHVATTPIERRQLRAESLRAALEELGATYVKLGQLLSTRPDVLPEAYVEELERLQDAVGPFPWKQVEVMLADELGRPITEVFAEIDDKPVASASLSQVHRAVLHEHVTPEFPTREVAVKILRPGIEREVEVDIDLLAELAQLVRRSVVAQRYDVVAIVDQLSRTLRDELILTIEARSAGHFRDALTRFDLVRIPRIVDELTTKRMLIMEFIHGQRIIELADDDQRPDLADQLWRAYLEQILVDGMFHCDPHPGNFRLDPDGRIVILDFGMVGHLTREMQIQLLSLLLALADRDGERAAEVCMEIGIPGPRFADRRFKSELSMMVTRYTGRALQDLGLGKVLLELVRTGYNNDIQIPPELMLLGKTLLNLEGICRRLDRNLDPISTVRDMAASLLAQQLRRELSRHKALAATLEARSLLTEVPTSVRRILRRAAANELRLGLQVEGTDEIKAAVQTIANRVTLGLITAALIVGSALLLNVQAGPILWGYPIFALVGFLLAAGLGIYLVAKTILMDR